MPHAAEEFELVVERLDASSNPSPAYLSPAERARADRFFLARHRRLFVAARTRLRQLLGARLGLAPEAVELVYGPHGKPRLAQGNLHFSVSHCDDVALFGFSSAEIGVDIEPLRSIAGADAIAASVFSPRERADCAAHGFLYCWTRKEALAKAIGKGLSAAPREIDTATAPGWRLHSFFPLPGFIAAVAYLT
jgi:4'-phosphopantetheinyl transferase